MKKSDILKERRALYLCSGKGEYLFFTSILISALALCAVLVMLANSLFKTPEISSVYGEIINSQINIKGPKSPFSEAAGEVFFELLHSFLFSLPTALVFLTTFLFIVCPVYQGTIRWGAYLTEMRRPLPISAILFYFSSPSLYFKSVFLSLRIFIRKFVFAVLFFSLPSALLFISLIFGSDYYGQKAAAGAVLLLSLVLFVISLVLYVIYCQKYAAVRYLFSLGNGKKIFKRSAIITKKKRVWFFVFNLRLVPNLLLFAFVITAPFALSRILCAHCLAINAVIAQKRAA